MVWTTVPEFWWFYQVNKEDGFVICTSTHNYNLWWPNLLITFTTCQPNSNSRDCSRLKNVIGVKCVREVVLDVQSHVFECSTSFEAMHKVCSNEVAWRNLAPVVAWMYLADFLPWNIIRYYWRSNIFDDTCRFKHNKRAYEMYLEAKLIWKLRKRVQLALKEVGRIWPRSKFDEEGVITVPTAGNQDWCTICTWCLQVKLFTWSSNSIKVWASLIIPHIGQIPYHVLLTIELWVLRAWK